MIGGENPNKNIYEQVIELLNQAYSAQKFASIRARYAANGDRAEEVIAAERAAQICWLKAKELYCSDKNALDAHYRDNPVEVFNCMVEVIEKETQEAAEKELLK